MADIGVRAIESEFVGDCGDHDTLRDECGVFGCVAAAPWPNTLVDVAVDVIYPALANLQHRSVD